MNIGAVSSGFAYLASPGQSKSVTRTENSKSNDVANANAAETSAATQSEETSQASDSSSNTSPGKLSEKQQAQVLQLKARDLEVRQHEAAHLAAAGGLATSGASFTYQRGPDGVNYAIGGEVSIDVSPGRTPAETLAKAAIVQAAALAPAEPSGPDRAVAAQAQQLAAQARAELNAQSLGGTTDNNSKAANDTASSTQDKVLRAYQDFGGSSSTQISIYA